MPCSGAVCVFKNQRDQDGDGRSACGEVTGDGGDTAHCQGVMWEEAGGEMGSMFRC